MLEGPPFLCQLVRFVKGGNTCKAERVLWLAPNLNHYKARMLDRLDASGRVELVVICGLSDHKNGHSYDSEFGFRLVEIDVRKCRWGYNAKVWRRVAATIRSERPTVVLMPAEAKHLPLVMLISALRTFLQFRLVSYNHSRVARSGDVSWSDYRVSRFMLGRYDHVVFYSEIARQNAVNAGLVPFAKTSFAPNTLDIAAIRGHQETIDVSFPTPPTILFIGRLLPQKGVDRLLKYFDRLRRKSPKLRLEIVGDGPLRDVVRHRSNDDKNIIWHSAISDEAKISAVMARATVVFIPGETGLGIVHAFAYGKPFMTIDKDSIRHGPEVDYLDHGRNGLYLSGEIERDEEAIQQLLNEANRYKQLAQGAYETGTALEASTWVGRVCDAICADDQSTATGSSANTHLCAVGER